MSRFVVRIERKGFGQMLDICTHFREYAGLHMKLQLITG